MFTTRTKLHKPNYTDQLDNSMKPKAKHISTRDGYFIILHPPKILYEDEFHFCRRPHRNKGYIEIRAAAVPKTQKLLGSLQVQNGSIFVQFGHTVQKCKCRETDRKRETERRHTHTHTHTHTCRHSA